VIVCSGFEVLLGNLDGPSGRLKSKPSGYLGGILGKCTVGSRGCD
jgi:hypothetical protein